MWFTFNFQPQISAAHRLPSTAASGHRAFFVACLSTILSIPGMRRQENSKSFRQQGQDPSCLVSASGLPHMTVPTRLPLTFFRRMYVDMQIEWTQNPHEAAAELANSHKQHSQRAPVQEPSRNLFIQSGRFQAPGSKMLLVSGPQGG